MVGPVVSAPAAHAIYGDTHIVGQGIRQTVDCNDATLYVLGSDNIINVVGSCWAITVQGSSNTIIADTVVNDITVFGIDQTVFFHNGEPALIDRGRELGMANRLQRIPA
ncbi:DUF3060 domain-containing protein [Mycobacterium sp. 1274756.6]|uniref:DUF3060 domain-containing protein n=1 Tax=Mycobacterium sp. 1274756.6 TaxID=1834076 RepID=UPI001E37F62F|nr:DUF3060 domain-containing protein [Mycobacterium sp. 1274756.6]